MFIGVHTCKDPEAGDRGFINRAVHLNISTSLLAEIKQFDVHSCGKKCKVREEAKSACNRKMDHRMR
jgi:hypothetical protein